MHLKKFCDGNGREKLGIWLTMFKPCQGRGPCLRPTAGRSKAASQYDFAAVQRTSTGGTRSEDKLIGEPMAWPEYLKHYTRADADSWQRPLGPQRFERSNSGLTSEGAKRKWERDFNEGIVGRDQVEALDANTGVPTGKFAPCC